MSASYKKTQKGEEEMATRAHHLSARGRSLLVMVDGKITMTELARRAAVLGDADALVSALVDGGFIEATGGVEAGSAAAATAATAVYGAKHQDAARFASRFLLEALGTASDLLGARVETCRDPVALNVLLEKCREEIRAGAGGKKADQFWAGVADKLGGSS
jgi:hypothetical protein